MVGVKMFPSRLTCTTFAVVVYITEPSQYCSVAQYGLSQDIVYNTVDWCILTVQCHRTIRSVG
jgi:hypothetical protein